MALSGEMSSQQYEPYFPGEKKCIKGLWLGFFCESVKDKIRYPPFGAGQVRKPI